MTLPNPGLTIDVDRTAILIVDPQNDFLSPTGAAWGVVGESVICHPVDIAAEVFHTAHQPRLAWSFDVEIRPFAEKW